MPKLRQPLYNPFREFMNVIWPYVLAADVRKVARILGVSRELLYRRRGDPKKLTLEEIDMLQRICDIPYEVIAEAMPWRSKKS